VTRFHARLTASAADLDELGHVNNAVWVRWIQDVAVAHWAAVAPSELQAAVYWVVTRHEVDYRGNVAAGAEVLAETWVGDAPRGARFDRHMRFTDAGGRVLVEARIAWAMIDRATGRPMRVRDEVTAFFRTE